MNGTDNERVAGVVILLIIGGAVLPTLIPTLGATVTSWLLDQDVLVDPDQSLLTIPGLDAGLDSRRLVIALLLVAAAILFTAAARRGSGSRR